MYQTEGSTVTPTGWVGNGPRRLVVTATVVALVIAGGAVGIAAASGPGEGDGATISPEVTGAEGEQVVLVYFGTDRIGAAERSDGVTVDQLKDRADSAQAPLDRYAERTPGVTVLNNFWLGNIAVVTIDHDRTDVTDLATIEGVEHVGPNFEVTVDTSAAAAAIESTVHPTIEPSGLV